MIFFVMRFSATDEEAKIIEQNSVETKQVLSLSWQISDMNQWL